MTKTDRLEARLDPQQRAVLEQAAALRGQSLSAFLLGAALTEARAVIQAASVTTIPADFAERFAKVLDAPPGAFATRFTRLASYEPLDEVQTPSSSR